MNTWRIEDFITYLYYMAAEADMHTEEAEIASTKFMINRILKSYLPGIEYNYDESISIIKRTEGIFETNVTKAIEFLIQKFHFSSDMVTDIVSDLNDIIRTDDRVTEQEHAMVAKIRAALKNA